jgi:short-subunit dehydrogenase
MQAKTILITGAGSGIGKDTAIGLAKRGHHVIASDVTRQRLSKLEAEATSLGLELEYIGLDITKQENVDESASKYAVDVLINNAGSGETGPIAEVPLERVKRNFDINVFGTLRVIQAFTPGMIKRKSGRIIIMGSMVGLTTPMFFSPYSSTKAALESIAASLRNELSYFNIPVIVINPGRIDGGHNALIAATKYEWLKEGSPYYPLIEEMKRQFKKLSRTFIHVSATLRHSNIALGWF